MARYNMFPSCGSVRIGDRMIYLIYIFTGFILGVFFTSLFKVSKINDLYTDIHFWKNAYEELNKKNLEEKERIEKLEGYINNKYKKKYNEPSR